MRMRRVQCLYRNSKHWFLIKLWYLSKVEIISDLLFVQQWSVLQVNRVVAWCPHVRDIFAARAFSATQFIPAVI